MQSAFAEDDKNLVNKYISRSVASFYGISVIGFTVAIFIAVPFIHRIKDSFFIENDIFIGTFVNLLFIQRCQLSAAFLSCANKVPYAFPFVITAIASVIFEFITMKYMHLGIWG